jgi:hypothetical protein
MGSKAPLNIVGHCLAQQSFVQMRANKPSITGDKHNFHRHPVDVVDSSAAKRA